jgi:hypothetical protein
MLLDIFHLVVRSWKLETGNWKLENGNWPSPHLPGIPTGNPLGYSLHGTQKMGSLIPVSSFQFPVSSFLLAYPA